MAKMKKSLEAQADQHADAVKQLHHEKDSGGVAEDY